MRQAFSLFTMVVLSVPLMLVSCSSAPGKDSENYYPLELGRKWEYQITEMKEGAIVKKFKLFATNVDIQEVGGIKCTRRKMVRIEENSGDFAPTVDWFWFAENKDGITKNGVYEKKDGKQLIFPLPRIYLKIPYNAGTVWEDRQNGVKERATIEGTNETVTVPAGTFKNCMKINKVSSINSKELISTTTIWYCPGIGVVKVISKSHSGNHEDGQLISYSK